MIDLFNFLDSLFTLFSLRIWRSREALLSSFLAVEMQEDWEQVKLFSLTLS